MQERVSAQLNAIRLNSRFNADRIDFSLRNKCQPAISLNVLNKEEKNVRYKVDTYYLYSDEFAGSIVKYIEDNLRRSNVPIDAASGKEVHVSIEHLEMDWNFTWNAFLLIKITIPEINLSRKYESNQKSGTVFNALSYAVHLVTMQFLSDPVVQSYITCNADRTIVQNNDNVLSGPMLPNQLKPKPDMAKASQAAAHVPISNDPSKKDPDIICEIKFKHAYHVGDDYSRKFDQPHAQNHTYKHTFDISDLKRTPHYFTIWVSGMVPNAHNRFIEGDYQNMLLINNRRICVLNDYVYGTVRDLNVRKITIPLRGRILRNGRNWIKIIAGERSSSNYNKNDFQIHKISFNYKK